MAGWVGAPPSLVAPRRGLQERRARSVPAARAARGDGKADEEPYSDDPVRNRQKELQEFIVAAEDPEAILETVRELDGAIVISTALHRLGKVSTNHAEVLQDQRFLALLEKMRSRLPFFGSRQISNSMHGLGVLGCRDRGPWVDMVCVQIQRRIRDFEPQHVTNTLWACAKMQLHDPLMLRVLINRAIDDIGRFCPLDVSITTWACATLKLREVEWLRTIVRARLEFADFSPQNMSNFVWGLATLGFRNNNMVLAVGREASRKIQDFSPQELSNFCWALATMDLCDNLMLRAVAEEVDRRGDEVNKWDPQSLSNMMWAFATLAVKDDPLFKRLLEASTARIDDHDTQNMANSSWAAAMVGFRDSRWLDAAATAAVRRVGDCSTLHLAQLAFAFSRFSFAGERRGFLPALLAETLRRVEEFPPQSLFDVHDALCLFEALPRTPTPIERCLNGHYEELVAYIENFARLSADGGRPSAAQAAAYRQTIEKRDVVTLGKHHTVAFLRHFHLLCPEDDPFVKDGRRQIKEWRADAAAIDPTSRSTFHRAQCAWQLGCGDSADALADGVFESGGEPQDGGPDRVGIVTCRLRHSREGDAEIQALCAALGTSVLRGGCAPCGLKLNLHLSDNPCVSCLGATLQFGFRFPGVLKVSFDRSRMNPEDSVPIPRPPPPPSKNGNLLPYAPLPPDPAGGVDRSMLRKDGPDVASITSFYRSGAGGASRGANGAGLGGNEAVPHKIVKSAGGGASQQTFYFSARPAFYDTEDYSDCAGQR